MKQHVVIKRRKDELTILGQCYQLKINLKSGDSQFCNGQGKLLFEFPLNVRIEAKKGLIDFGFPLLAQVVGNVVTISDAKPPKSLTGQKYVFDFGPDSFTCRYEAAVAAKNNVTPIQVEYLRGPAVGMLLNPMKEGFCVPKAPMSEEDYRNIFPTAGLDGLATPAILNIGMKFHNGFVGVGLLDYSDGTTFGISFPSMGLMVDAPGGNVCYRSTECYIGPRVLFTFPADGWDGIEVFRKKLEEEDQLAAQPEKYAWWKRPVYCTYGDQIMQLEPVLHSDIYWDAPGFTQEWVKQAVLTAEKRLGYNDFSVLIDAFWQRRWDTDPVGDPKRFPDMRKLVDWIHRRGHKVLLWYEPHALDLSQGKGAIAHKFDVVGKYTLRHDLLHPNKLQIIDYSSANAPAYLQEISRRLFSPDADCLDADGVKLDFVGFVPPTEKKAQYFEPANGMGFKMVERYLRLFRSAAKAVKPDVMLNYSSSDPRVAHLFDINRLHDTKVTPLERERRARISALANPDLLIDSDGAVMMCDWVTHTYISAAIYSTPTLYYADVFNDGQRLPDKMMKTLGKLFRMCAHRSWGRPEFISYGNWRLRDMDANIIGESYDGKLCWLQTGTDIINVICFDDQNMQVHLHGIQIKNIYPSPDHLNIKKDKINAYWKGGILYELTELTGVKVSRIWQ